MAISTTTFEQRIGRIDKVQPETATKGKRRGARRSVLARLCTVPSLTGIGILAGGTAYAWNATQAELTDIAVTVPHIINNIQMVMAFTG